MNLERFLSKIYPTQKDISPSTETYYTYVRRSFEVYLRREAHTEDLCEEHVNGYVSWWLQTRSRSQGLARRNSLAGWWKVAAKLGMAPPFESPRTVKLPDIVVRPLAPKKLEDAIDVLSGLKGNFRQRINGKLVDTGLPRAAYLCTFVRCVYETSLRISDIHQLEAVHVLPHGRLMIIQQKTKHARRVKLSDELIKDVMAWHDGRRYIWPQLDIHQILRRLETRVGFRLHSTDIRKTAITAVETQQAGMGWIFAGHKSPRTTQTWYIDHESAYTDMPAPPPLDISGKPPKTGGLPLAKFK